MSEHTPHTPGPWSYRSRELDDWGIVRAPVDADGFSPVICQARDPYCLDDEDLAIHRANKTDPWEANARLIAAAPDLLEALKACRDQFDFYAREHRAAGKHEKAATNERFVFLATQALTKAQATPHAG